MGLFGGCRGSRSAVLFVGTIPFVELCIYRNYVIRRAMSFVGFIQSCVYNICMDSEEERFTVLGAIGLRRGGLLPGGGLK